MPVVMVTKSEEDATLKEAHRRQPARLPGEAGHAAPGADGHHAHPRGPADPLAGAGARVRRALPRHRGGALSWARLARLDRSLRGADAVGRGPRRRRRAGAARVAARALSRHAPRVRARSCAREYPRWLRELEGDRPPLSVDVVAEFVLPVLARDKKAIFIVVDCLRVDQWRVLEPLLAPLFDVETTHYYSILPTATPYARNALFSGLFPGEIAGALSRLVEGARRRVAQRAREGPAAGAARGAAGHRRRCATRRSPPPSDWTTSSATCPARSPARACTRSSSTSSTCSRTAAPSRRFCSRSRATRSRCARSRKQWFERSALLTLLQGSLAPEDLGGDHQRPRLAALQHADDRLRQARRHGQPALQVRRGPARRASGAGAAVHQRGRFAPAAPRRRAATRCSRPATRSSCIPPSCASTRAATAGRSCTAG